MNIKFMLSHKLVLELPGHCIDILTYKIIRLPKLRDGLGIAEI